MISNIPNSLKLTAGLCGAFFIGYCVYFDRKRRSHPDFKQKLKQRRLKAKETEKNSIDIDIPDLKDPKAMQEFFLQQVSKGEELLAQGDINNGTEHLSLAIAVCSQQKQLLSLLEQTLPPSIFPLILTKLPEAQKKILSSKSMPILIAEEDVD